MFVSCMGSLLRFKFKVEHIEMFSQCTATNFEEKPLQCLSVAPS